MQVHRNPILALAQTKMAPMSTSPNVVAAEMAYQQGSEERQRQLEAAEKAIQQDEFRGAAVAEARRRDVERAGRAGEVMRSAAASAQAQREEHESRIGDKDRVPEVVMRAVGIPNDDRDQVHKQSSLAELIDDHSRRWAKRSSARYERIAERRQKVSAQGLLLHKRPEGQDRGRDYLYTRSGDTPVRGIAAGLLSAGAVGAGGFYGSRRLTQRPWPRRAGAVLAGLGAAAAGLGAFQLAREDEQVLRVGQEGLSERPLSSLRSFGQRRLARNIGAHLRPGEMGTVGGTRGTAAAARLW